MERGIKKNGEDEKGTQQSSIKGADGVCLGGFATGGMEWKMVKGRGGG